MAPTAPIWRVQMSVVQCIGQHHKKSQEEIVKEKTVKKDEKKKPQKTLKEKRKAKREKENK